MTENNLIQPKESITTEKQLMESPELERIANNVIAKYHLEFGPAEVGYFLVYPFISKQKMGKAIKSTPEAKYYSGNDYFIEVSGELWDMLDTDTKEMLVFHQLLHLDPTFKSKNQEWKMNLRKPDFADFYTINDKYGNEWYKTIQATASSLYDLDPKQEAKVRV